MGSKERIEDFFGHHALAVLHPQAQFQFCVCSKIRGFMVEKRFWARMNLLLKLLIL